MATLNESTRSGIVRAAVVQAAPVLFDTPRSLQKLADLASDAARQGAELVVFPEAFIGGYPTGHAFGVSVGIRSPEGREDSAASSSGADLRTGRADARQAP
jgi:nitrilase